MFLILYRC